jgi:hypothetical protein
VLNRAARDCDLCGAAFAAIDQNVSRRRCIGRHIALYVACADMEVSNFPAARYDTATRIVANVTPNDVSLMEINVIEKHAAAAVLVNVAIRDQHVSVSLNQMDSVPYLVHHASKDR